MWEGASPDFSSFAAEHGVARNPPQAVGRLADVAHLVQSPAEQRVGPRPGVLDAKERRIGRLRLDGVRARSWPGLVKSRMSSRIW